MIRRYRIRFNLGKGKHYLKWKLTDRLTRTDEYYDPEFFEFVLLDCCLINYSKTSTKIFSGSNKTVCAWIEFNDFVIDNNCYQGLPIHYNPKVAPFWRDHLGNNIDRHVFDRIYTIDRSLFVI